MVARKSGNRNKLCLTNHWGAARPLAVRLHVHPHDLRRFGFRAFNPETKPAKIDEAGVASQSGEAFLEAGDVLLG
jgi:hypothetical protein